MARGIFSIQDPLFCRRRLPPAIARLEQRGGRPRSRFLGPIAGTREFSRAARRKRGGSVTIGIKCLCAILRLLLPAASGDTAGVRPIRSRIWFGPIRLRRRVRRLASSLRNLFMNIFHIGNYFSLSKLLSLSSLRKLSAEKVFSLSG